MEKNLKKTILLLLLISGCISFGGYWKKSKQYIEQNQPGKAIVVVKEELNKSPDDNLLHFRYGLLLYETNNYYNASLQIDTAFILGIDSSTAQKEAENFGVSIELIYLKASIEEIKNNKYFLAIEILEKVITISKDNAVAYNFLGYCYFMSEDIILAEFNLKKSVEIDQYYNEAKYNLSVIYYSQGKYNDVINILNNRENLQNEAMFILNMSLIASLDTSEILNRREELEQRFELILEDNISDEMKFSVYYNIGLIRMISNDYSGTEEMFVEALKYDISSPLIYYNYGVLLMNQNRYREAKENFSQAISLDPFIADAYTNRAICEEKLGEINLSKLDYIRGMELRE